MQGTTGEQGSSKKIVCCCSILFILIVWTTTIAMAKPTHPKRQIRDWPSDYETDAISSWNEQLDSRTLPIDEWNNSPADYKGEIDSDWPARRSSKRSPACIRRCVEQGALHPIQCHSLC